MQASYAGPLASYNSLTDEHLSEYFSRPRTFRHLRRMGLVTRDGRIMDEGIIRVNNARKEHKARSKDVLADSIVNKAIELERKRRGDLKKKLELLEKYEIVEKVKSQKRHPVGIQEFNPYRSVPPPPPRLSTTLDMHFEKLSISSDQISDMRYLVGKITRGRSIPHPRAQSPYEEELASRFSTPVPHPPSTPRPHTAASVRGRRSVIKSRPSTAPSGMGMGHRRGTQRPITPRSQPMHSDVNVTLKFIGTGLHLDNHSMESNASDVLVVQQHCGGNTVPVYRGKVKPKDVLTFVSKRHIGMPYGLTIYLDGMMDSRVSACCEYRHQCGKLLGSKTAHFKLIKVEGGKPCYRCEIERNKKYLQERQDREIKHVLEGTSSLKELITPQQTATKDEESLIMIHDSPLRSSSEVSAGSTKRLESQECDASAPQDISRQEVHSDVEKASLASHSNVSVSSKGSANSKSSRVSVASSKSSIHSHNMSTASKASSQSSKSSIRSSSEHENPTPSSSSHSLRERESELPTSILSLTREKDDAESGEAAGVDEYNYDDDNFEEEEESKQSPLEEHSDNMGPTVSEENDNEPGETADADYNYENDTFEEPNGEEEPPKQQSEEYHTEGKRSRSPALAERNTESEKATTPAVLNQQPGSESDAVGSSSDVEDNGQETHNNSSHNIEGDEDKLPGSQTDDTPATVHPGGDENAVMEPEHEDTPVRVSVEESDKESPNVKEPQTSASGEEPTMETKSTDTTDAPENQQGKQGILVTSSKRKPIQFSVSFEANKQTDEESTIKDLSASQTIEEAKKMLQKPQSNVSLGSLLNDQDSSLDLSGSDDEDIPDLERKISDLIDESSNGGKTVSQNMDTAVNVEETKEVSLSEEPSIDSQKLAADEKAPELIDINSSRDKPVLQQNTDNAMVVVEDENDSVEQEKTGDGETISTNLQVGALDTDEDVPDLQPKVGLPDVSEDDSSRDNSGSQETAVVDKEKQEDTVEQPGQENTDNNNESSQVDAVEVESISSNFESQTGGLEDKNGHVMALSEEENVKESAESHSQEIPAEDEHQMGKLDVGKDTLDLEVKKSDYSKDRTALQRDVDTSYTVVEDAKESIEQLSQEMTGEGEDIPTNPQEQGADGDRTEQEQNVSNLIDDVRSGGKSGSQENMDTAVIAAENEKEDSPKLSDEGEVRNSHTNLIKEVQQMEETFAVGQDHEANAGSQGESQDYHQTQGDPESTTTSMPVKQSDHGSVASGLSLSSSKSSLTSVSSQASHS